MRGLKMKVNLLNEDNAKFDLDIVFHKTKFDDRRLVVKSNGKVHELIDTHCIVFLEGEELTHTIAYQNPKDNYNKIVGRKVALAKAIKEMYFVKRHGTGSDEYHLGMRKQIWQVFKETFMKSLVEVNAEVDAEIDAEVDNG
jgi:hypothetical protein